MRYRIRTQNLAFNDNPVPTGTGFLRFLLRHLDEQNIAACSEYCLGFLRELPTVLPNKQLFTLVNVCSPFYGQSFGQCPPPPKESLPLFATWYFTFAIKHTRYDMDTEVDYYSVKGVDCRTWTTGQEATVEFVTIGITPERAKQFGLKNTLRHVQAVYNLVGAYTKRSILTGNYQPSASFTLRKQRYLSKSSVASVSQDHPLYWSACAENWQYPGLLDPASIDDSVASYCFYHVDTEQVDAYYHAVLFERCRESLASIMSGETTLVAFAALVSRYTKDKRNPWDTSLLNAIISAFRNNVIPDNFVNELFLNDVLNLDTLQSVVEVVNGNSN